MLSLINKNKYVKFFCVIFVSVLFVLAFIPILSITLEILYNAGTALGSFIRTYGVC